VDLENRAKEVILAKTIINMEYILYLSSN